MDLYKCKSFYTVAELGSFSRAAEKLFLTQPAVSAQIKDLEYEYKTRLFDRIGRTVRLTPEGEALLPYVRSMLNTYDESHFAVELLKDQEDGSIRLGVSNLPGARLVPSCLSKFLSVHPRVTFLITAENSQTILEMLRRNKLDLAIIGARDEDLKTPELVGRVLLRDEIVLAVSKSHPLAVRDSVNVADLSDLPIIVPLKNTVSRQAVDRLFRRHSVPHRIAYEIDNKAMIKSMVEHNLGVAFFSRLEVEKEAKSEWIKILSVQDAHLSRRIHVLHHRDKELSPSCTLFYEFLFRHENPERILRAV